MWLHSWIEDWMRRTKEVLVAMKEGRMTFYCGLSFDCIVSMFGTYSEVKGVYVAAESGTRVIFYYHEESSAHSTPKELDGPPYFDLGGYSLQIHYSVQLLGKVKFNITIALSTSASNLNIPGSMSHDFVVAEVKEVNMYPPGVGLSPHIDTHSHLRDEFSAFP
ncbi:Hypothetical predicted protein [Olea europaea subsp. europaea]|uniref:Uncharacterized protein n=1 Tax=Olea europaea subsp. europaea TaxID=158383 RepID=A0A8S0QM30_OLEEU|nr:Hypothetical predicted protein [Olea europaea subsp. europaea]